MKYSEALEKVLSLTDMERMVAPAAPSRYNLNRMYQFLERLGNPHLQVPTIHVAGTKGKGSTASMINSILLCQGYSTGLYTSPHLHAFRERIVIGREPISEEEFAGLVEKLWPVLEEMADKGGEGRVTTFELLTAMAITAFVDAKLDFQVLEVGLGGRLDATNVVEKPVVCVITSISLDHVRILGDTLGEIAQEKSGILKAGAVVITAPQADDALAVIRERGKELGIEVVNIGDAYRWGRGSFDLRGQSFSVEGPRGRYEVWMPLLGGHQIENATLAIAALDALSQRGVSISREAIIEGLKRVHWSGRLEVLSSKPLVVADGAHNPYSMSALRQAIREYFRYERLLLVFGASADKDLEGMVQELAGLRPVVIATSSRHPRSVDASALAKAFANHGIDATPVETVGQAVKAALKMAGEKDLVLATGSLYVVAEAIEEVRGIKPELYPISAKPSISYQGTR